MTPDEIKAITLAIVASVCLAPHLPKPLSIALAVTLLIMGALL